MRRFVLLASLIGCSDGPTTATPDATAAPAGSATVPAAPQASPERFDFEWRTAGVTGIDGTLSISLYVYTGGGQTFLNYNVYTYDPGSGLFTELASGNGQIPEADFVATSTSRMSLDTDLATNGPFGVRLGPRGRIRIAWIKNQEAGYYQRVQGTVTTVTPSYRYHQTGTSTTQHAVASGNLMDWTLPEGSAGSIGVSRNLQILIERVN